MVSSSALQGDHSAGGGGALGVGGHGGERDCPEACWDRINKLHEVPQHEVEHHFREIQAEIIDHCSSFRRKKRELMERHGVQLRVKLRELEPECAINDLARPTVLQYTAS